MGHISESSNKNFNDTSNVKVVEENEKSDSSSEARDNSFTEVSLNRIAVEKVSYSKILK